MCSIISPISSQSSSEPILTIEGQPAKRIFNSVLPVITKFCTCSFVLASAHSGGAILRTPLYDLASKFMTPDMLWCQNYKAQIHVLHVKYVITCMFDYKAAKNNCICSSTYKQTHTQTWRSQAKHF